MWSKRIVDICERVKRSQGPWTCRTSRQSLPPLVADLDIRPDGVPLRSHLTSTYDLSKKQVLRRPVEPSPSPRIAADLAEVGHDAVHVRDVGLARSTNAALLAFAARTERVIVSNDSDFGELLARTEALRPSVLLVRRQQSVRADDLFRVVLRAVTACGTDLERGAVVVADGSRLRVRRLPIRRSDS
jgi:predicted nuclease of predicted toxin-antitoxin system